MLEHRPKKEENMGVGILGKDSIETSHDDYIDEGAIYDFPNPLRRNTFSFVFKSSGSIFSSSFQFNGNTCSVHED